MSQVTSQQKASQQSASQQNGSPQHSSANSQAEQQIRDLVSQYVKAVTAKDVARIASLYSDDVVAFDAILALQFIGKAAYIEHWHTCMGFAKGEMQTSWMRSTQCWRNTADGWKIAHEHLSVPFAETKEQLTSFYLVEAHDLNEFMQIARAFLTRPPRHPRPISRPLVIVNKHPSSAFCSNTLLPCSVKQK